VGDAIAVFLLTSSALFPIVDPLAGSPIFLAMTGTIHLKREGRSLGALP
jgi:small neutral amino acid transporter SnatA (MarC family)